VKITALAGGVGAARMLSGLATVAGAEAVTAIINTADDMVLHGLYICPDVDTVTYTLAGAGNPETGWGLAGETWQVMAAVAAFEGVAPGGPGSLSWFNLGDRDLGTHLYRTGRLASGATLSEVTAEVSRRYGVAARLLPMTDHRVETRVTIADGPGPEGHEVGFQDYFVGMRHSVPVRSVRFAGVEHARPAPGVIDAIERADIVVVCPSNPIVSIGPLLAVDGIAAAVARRRPDAVAVSPIVAGRALKGPADRMLAELGQEASVVGVARLWSALAARLVIDEADAALAPAVEAEGMEAVVAPSVMSGPAEAARLARAVLAAATTGQAPAP
jgi:LPPG:FO 2-phospho-L-lactate transferase